MTCPSCGEAGLALRRAGEIVLLICPMGCTARRIAAVLGLDLGAPVEEFEQQLAERERAVRSEAA